MAYCNDSVHLYCTGIVLVLSAGGLVGFCLSLCVSRLKLMDIADNGRVLKAINRGRTDVKPYMIEVISVFLDGSPVTDLRIRRHPTNRHRHRLIVMSRDEIRSIPLHRCNRYLTCRYRLSLAAFWQADQDQLCSLSLCVLLTTSVYIRCINVHNAIKGFSFLFCCHF